MLEQERVCVHVPGLPAHELAGLGPPGGRDLWRGRTRTDHGRRKNAWTATIRGHATSERAITRLNAGGRCCAVDAATGRASPGRRSAARGRSLANFHRTRSRLSVIEKARSSETVRSTSVRRLRVAGRPLTRCWTPSDHGTAHRALGRLDTPCVAEIEQVALLIVWRLLSDSQTTRASGASSRPARRSSATVAGARASAPMCSSRRSAAP